MGETQEQIYFASGSSREEIENSPFVERLLRSGREVLYMVDPVDEYTIQNLPEYEGKKFQNVAKDGLKIGDESEEESVSEARVRPRGPDGPPTHSHTPRSTWRRRRPSFSR